MGMTAKQVEIIATALFEGKTRTEACKLAGMRVENCTRTCNNAKVQNYKAMLEAEQERREAARNEGVEEPMTIKEYQAFLKKKMLDAENKDNARYAEMYGKTIRAFTEKLEVDSSVSYADILIERKKKSKE